MSYEDIRYQFRLNRARQKKLKALADAAGLSPSLMAKTLCEMAIDGEQEGLSELRQQFAVLDRDLLIIRAGIEQLFRRNNRERELADAVDDVTVRRAARQHTLTTANDLGEAS